ncbi:MAG TPA: c-type cytochrome [Bryobacteraceae bacterium]|nr:c-type cytochrome [Bryobacteraceae bacterium]
MRLLLPLLVLPHMLAQQPSLGTSASVARGDKLFAQGCAVGYCHGAGGSAARSPRLRGRTFDRDYLLKVIRNGIPNTAMPAWGDRLTDTDIDDIADYIQSLATAPAAVMGNSAAESPSAVPAEKSAEAPEEHRQGRDLFFDAAKEARCAVCHRLDGFGASIGPDVTKVTAIAVSDAVQVLRYGRPRTVRTIILHDGDRFPGIVLDRTSAASRIFDLTSNPPVLRNLLASEIQSIQRQTNWRHGSAVRGYAPEELQAIWDYIRFVAGKK